MFVRLRCRCCVEDNKEEVRLLEGLKPLIAALSNPKRDVQIAAAGALMNCAADSMLFDFCVFVLFVVVVCCRCCCCC